MHCALTLIAGLAFNYIAFKAISNLSGSGGATEAAQGTEAGILAIVAFALGYFPTLALSWFNRIAHSTLGMRQRRADVLPLSLVDGISDLHETRLREEGIDNLQNLAAVKIDQLLVNTRFSAQQVVEWVDQAVLYLYLEPSEIDSFRRGGVRCISDFQKEWEPYYMQVPKKGPEDRKSGREIHTPYDSRDARQSRAQQLQSTPERLDVLYQTTKEGPNMAYIDKYWENLEKVARSIQEIALEEPRVQEAMALVRQAWLAERIARKSYRVIINNYKRAKEKAPRLVDPLIGLYHIYYTMGLYDQAIDELEAARDLVPKNYSMRGYISDILNRTDEAIEEYEKAIETGTDDPSVLINVAYLYMGSDRANKAIDRAQAAIKRDEKNAEYHIVLGDAYNTLQHHTDEAIKSYERAFELNSLDPQNASLALCRIGNMYSNLGRYDDAIAAFQQAHNWDPRTAQPYIGMGRVYYFWGRYDEAIKSCAHALELDPQNFDAHSLMGWVYQRLDHTDKAIRSCDRAIGGNPEAVAPHYCLGEVYRRLDCIGEAISEYQRALGLQPKSPFIHAYLAACYRQRDDKADCAEQIKIALELAGESMSKEEEYVQACFHALCENADKAVEMLETVLKNKQRSADYVRDDIDFEFIRNDSRFKTLIEEYSKLAGVEHTDTLSKIQST
jgi:tetratricopeptide (TPR) repeat protein